MNLKNLVQAAKKARSAAYAPYSKFKVGAAVLTDKGKIYTGCNVENASYGLTQCAERVALAKAVSEGARKILAVAVIADTKKPVSPCGACRQVISEFGSGSKVVMASLNGKVSVSEIEELLPFGFSL